MALNLYRRHRRDCEGGHPEESRSGELEERQKGWKKCECPIFASGVLNRKFKRRQTEKSTWEDAKTVVEKWEEWKSWDIVLGFVPAPASAPKSVSQVHGGDNDQAVTIQSATDAYLANRGNREIATSTMRKYRTLTKQLLEYAQVRGHSFMNQLGPTQMDEFYGLWKDGIRAKGKKLERLKGLMKFCKKRKFIKENPVEDLEPPVGSSTAANKMPLTDDELTKIYEACDQLPTIRWQNSRCSGEWGGEDVKTMIMLLAWTGLRISDGATFDMSRVTKNPEGGANVLIRMKKTGKFKSEPLFTWIDDWLYERLLARERQFGSQIFVTGRSKKLETVTDLWRRKINRVFDLAGQFRCGTPSPHIFRHTFVRLLLQRDVSVEDVAELIGDTPQMVRQHYAQWVPERQERLTNILRNKLASAPKPKLAVIAGGRKRKSAAR